MSSIVVIRNYRTGDEIGYKEMISEGIMSSLNNVFMANLFKEITFQMIILFSAIAFIFFGMPVTVCLLAIPVVVILTYIVTYLSFTAKVLQVSQEASNIPRIFMSYAFSSFWVAEAFEPYTMSLNSDITSYQIMTEQEFRQSNIDVSSRVKKIVGSIALSKSHNLDNGAFIKRLYVKRSYQRKGIESKLVDVAVQFAIDQGYRCANIVFSEHDESGREVCLKKGFELKQMYNKIIIGSIITVLMVELTFKIKLDPEDYKQELYRRPFVVN